MPHARGIPLACNLYLFLTGKLASDGPWPSDRRQAVSHVPPLQSEKQTMNRIAIATMLAVGMTFISADSNQAQAQFGYGYGYSPVSPSCAYQAPAVRYRSYSSYRPSYVAPGLNVSRTRVYSSAYPGLSPYGLAPSPRVGVGYGYGYGAPRSYNYRYPLGPSAFPPRSGVQLRIGF